MLENANEGTLFADELCEADVSLSLETTGDDIVGLCLQTLHLWTAHDDILKEIKIWNENPVNPNENKQMSLFFKSHVQNPASISTEGSLE